jgi:hypothetical protein
VRVRFVAQVDDLIVPGIQARDVADRSERMLVDRTFIEQDSVVLPAEVRAVSRLDTDRTMT